MLLGFLRRIRWLDRLLDLGKFAVEDGRKILFAGEQVQRYCFSAGPEGVVSLNLGTGVDVFVSWTATVSATVANS